MPDTVPCPKGDNPDRRSWFFDVSTASCRVSPTSGCDVTDDVGNRFYTLDECISTCLPGERAPHWFVSCSGGCREERRGSTLGEG